MLKSISLSLKEHSRVDPVLARVSHWIWNFLRIYKPLTAVSICRLQKVLSCK